MERIPGPINIKGFGPFESFPKALDATCSLVLSKPNAAVGHIKDVDVALRRATEYCAWLYYTPEQRYELSMLTDLEAPGDQLHGKASCLLPWRVDDPRYAPENIKYLFYVHNHALVGELSDRDIRLAVEMANIHGWVVETGGGRVPVAVIAFISTSGEGERPTCDGAYQYIPATSELLKWTKTGEAWHREKTGTVVWHSSASFSIQRE
ncbi:hypothetical protein [Hyalangium sp.]|uniref:hypothetical protein n=1 Tax=Hyalangium sp. TaxID=2028555 RepID=UPI002D6B7426|nr:hypothetical protein [Hyalangium sp.]HYH95181.1 hypothetical protein [Hyalangium sp.]